MAPLVQIPVTVPGKSHGGAQPLRYADADLHPQKFGILGRRRKFDYEMASAVIDIFGEETEAQDGA